LPREGCKAKIMGAERVPLKRYRQKSSESPAEATLCATDSPLWCLDLDVDMQLQSCDGHLKWGNESSPKLLCVTDSVSSDDPGFPEESEPTMPPPLTPVRSLADRLAARGATPPSIDDPGRECSAELPSELKRSDGSGLLRKEMQGFAASILRAHTVHELREVCKLRGVASCGTKDEVIRRLAFGDRPSADAAAPNPKRRLSFGDRPSADAVAPLPKRRRTSIASSPTADKASEESVQRRRRMSI